MGVWTRGRMANPYAAALDGLDLPDPVSSFFEFCREREAIRLRRESGRSGPWSSDRVFQKGRFLNVFREDDRGTKAILRFVQPVVARGDLHELVRALFFARWCNKQSTLDALDPALLEDEDKLQQALAAMENQPWCNETAY